MASRAKWLSQQIELHASVRYLRAPQRSAYIKSLQTELTTNHQQLQRMKVKLNYSIASDSCIKVDVELTSDIAKVIENTQVLQGD